MCGHRGHTEGTAGPGTVGRAGRRRLGRKWGHSKTRWPRQSGHFFTTNIRSVAMKSGEGKESNPDWGGSRRGRSWDSRESRDEARAGRRGACLRSPRGVRCLEGGSGLPTNITVPALTQRIKRLRKWRAGLPASHRTTAHDCSRSAGAGGMLDHGPPKPGTEMAQVTESKRSLLTLTLQET